MEKMIKSVSTSRYVVELHQDGNEFKIKHCNKAHGILHDSESIFDYGLADFMFNLKIDEYEGTHVN